MGILINAALFFKRGFAIYFLSLYYAFYTTFHSFLPLLRRLCSMPQRGLPPFLPISIV
jgi:hypothetical protein